MGARRQRFPLRVHMGLIETLSSLLCNMDDVAISTFLSWITPLEVPVGPGTLSLDDADFTDDDDNVTIDLKRFELRDLRLTGTASCDIPVIGTVDSTIAVVVDVFKIAG